MAIVAIVSFVTHNLLQLHISSTTATLTTNININITFLAPGDTPKLEQKTLNLYRCPKPLNSPLWNHFDALVDENAEMAKKVGHIILASRTDSNTDNETKGEEFGEGGGANNNQIPHRLIFTHKDNLFNCSISASNLTMSPNVHTLAENAKATVRAYHQIWPDLQYVFLTDDDCIDALHLTEPELIPFFNDPELEGRFTEFYMSGQKTKERNVTADSHNYISSF